MDSDLLRPWRTLTTTSPLPLYTHSPPCCATITVGPSGRVWILKQEGEGSFTKIVDLSSLLHLLWIDKHTPQNGSKGIFSIHQTRCCPCHKYTESLISKKHEYEWCSDFIQVSLNLSYFLKCISLSFRWWVSLFSCPVYWSMIVASYYSAAGLEYWDCELVYGFDFVPERKVCFQDQPRSTQVFFGHNSARVLHLDLFVCLSVCLSVCPHRTFVFFSATACHIETKFSPLVWQLK